MENAVGDVLQCEERLRTTLHCDDKEKLRRKLLLLQREYLRTAQRLQRAERSEAVRRHVRSRITHQQGRQDQGDPEVTWNPCVGPSSLTPSAANGKPSGVPQRQEHTGGPTDSENSRRSQVIRFSLPSDAACPQTPDPIHDAAGGHRPGSALRLRSRRSRLRWETRSAQAGRSTDNSEKGPEPNERIETAVLQRSDEEVKTGGTEVVNDSEELFSGTDSESSSLVLTHWNTCGQTKKGATEEPFIKGGQEQREKETELTTEGKKELDSPSSLLSCNPVTHTEGRGQDRQNGRKEREGIEEGEASRRQRDGGLCEDGSNTDQKTEQQIEQEKSQNNAAEKKEKKSEIVQGEHDVKGVGLMDSCTLVEGLPFPAEYYVRTTRRMASSQSQPDMQAVILSQLSTGRLRRSRGRGRKLDKRKHDREASNQHSPPDLSPLTTEPASVGPGVRSRESSGEISAQISACQLVETDPRFSPSVFTPRPARGRRRRRGRGRPRTPRCSLSLDTCQRSLGQTSDDPQPGSSPVSSSPSLHGADGPVSCPGPGEAAPGPDDLQPASIHTASQPSPGGVGGQSGSAPGHRVYPIFLKSSDRTNRSTQMSSPASWQSLLLPSSPSAQTSLLPLPSLSLSLRVNNFFNLDIPQDFHLPDDQFASLKLRKLHQATLEVGLERFTSPSYNTRRTSPHCESRHSSCDPTTPFPLPLDLVPTCSDSANPTEAEQSSAQSVDLQDRLIEKLTGASTSQSLSEALSDRETPREQQTESPRPENRAHTTSTESVVQECAADCVAQCKDTDSQSSFLPSNRLIHPSVTPQPHANSADRPAGRENDCVIGQPDERRVISSEEQTHCPGVVRPSEDCRSTEDQTIIKTASFDCPRQKTPKEPSNTFTAALVWHQNVKSPTKESKKRSEPTISPARDSKNQDRCPAHHSVPSQLLLSPSQASAPFTTSHLRSSASLSSPTLPSVGLTPHPVPASLPLTSSPSAPALNLPPPHSPSTQALSPPVLSPCPSLASLPSGQLPTSPAGQNQAPDEPSQTAEPADGPAVSGIQSEDSGGQVGLSTAETAAADTTIMRSTHTLKSPAGGLLVDACCLPGPSGSLCVAAAGKWAVCLWSQTAASDWSLVHTWSFTEPVINVFPVPDAAGLMCVTLGQLEIREVRTLSCSSLLQVLLCDGLVQAVVGVSNSRVVASSHSAPGSTLQVFTVLDSGSTLSSQALVSPGVCVGALAAVDGVPDALIGTDEGGHLFIWNLTTGQLLQRILLGDDLSHATCLRGYSYCGVLFVLLQHQLLSSLEEEEREAAEKDQMFLEEEERKQTALLSLVAVNPLTGKAVSATRLYPPKVWSGRLCEADVRDCSVVGLSQSGCVCVWELGRRGSSTPVWAPESEGWQVARWGTGGTLVTGHHNGDVTLHCYSTSQTPLCC